MLLFELFPAFLMIVSVVVGVWLYAANRRAPDERADDERKKREQAERTAAARAEGDSPTNAKLRRPSMMP